MITARHDAKVRFACQSLWIVIVFFCLRIIIHLESFNKLRVFDKYFLFFWWTRGDYKIWYFYFYLSR